MRVKIKHFFSANYDRTKRNKILISIFSAIIFLVCAMLTVYFLANSTPYWKISICPLIVILLALIAIMIPQESKAEDLKLPIVFFGAVFTFLFGASACATLLPSTIAIFFIIVLFFFCFLAVETEGYISHAF